MQLEACLRNNIKSDIRKALFYILSPGDIMVQGVGANDKVVLIHLLSSFMLTE